jgi:hypothetical protein
MPVAIAYSPCCPVFAQPKIAWDENETEILEHHRDLNLIGTLG